MWLVLILGSFVVYAGSENTCEIEASKFPVDTCVNCVTQSPFRCQFNHSDLDAGVCEVPSIPETPEVEGVFGPIYHFEVQCVVDCSLYINKKNPMDDCLECTRPSLGTPCHFVHRKKSCESFVTTGGLVHIKDYFKANKECKDDYCGKFNQLDLTSQQVCRVCTDSEHCVFKTSGVKECISRDAAGDGNLEPSDYYEDPKDCLEDCSLAFTPGLTIFEGCVNCLQGRGSCSFYLNGHCMKGPDYACANRKPYNFGSCPPITELLNCSSVCKPEPMPPGPPPSTTPSPPAPPQPPMPPKPPSSTTSSPPIPPPIPPHQPPLIRLAPPEPIEFPFNF